jgi:hypothetical protein
VKITRTSIAAALAAGVVSLAFAGAAAAEPNPKKPFALVPGSFHVTASTYQAGAHEDLTTAFDFAHNTLGHTYNDVRTVAVNLPPGFIGSNTAVPTCSVAQLLTPRPYSPLRTFNGVGAQCPPASQIGTITFSIEIGAQPALSTFPLYNIETTTPGVTAMFGSTRRFSPRRCRSRSDLQTRA